MALPVKDEITLRQIEREESQLSVKERLAPLLARLDALGAGESMTPKEDKKFFDEM